METKSESMKEYAKSYWNNLDIDKYKLVLHGPEQTDAQKLVAKQQMDKINQLTKVYNQQNNIEEVKPLFPQLD